MATAGQSASGHGFVVAFVVLVALLCIVNLVLNVIIFTRMGQNDNMAGIRIQGDNLTIIRDQAQLGDQDVPLGPQGGQQIGKVCPTVGPQGAAAAGAANKTKDRIWLIAGGREWGAHEYVDHDGVYKGFAVDLIAEVCGMVNATCKFMLDTYQHCFLNSGAGGIGIHSGFYDACAGYVHTVGRDNVFQFSKSYLKTESAYFYKKQGVAFDFRDVSGKKIGMIDGFAAGPSCLVFNKNKARGLPLPVEDIVLFTEIEILINALLNNQIHAVFLDEVSIDPYLAQVEKGPDAFVCSLGGAGMMSRKDSPFIKFWDDAYKVAKDAGKVKRVCDQAAQRHGSRGKIECV